MSRKYKKEFRKNCLHTSVINEGRELWVTFTPSTIILGQGTKIFEEYYTIAKKVEWRIEDERLKKIFNILKSSDNETILIGIKMLHTIFDFEIKEEY